MVNITPWTLLPQGKNLVPGFYPGPVRMGAKYLVHAEIRTPNHPARTDNAIRTTSSLKRDKLKLVTSLQDGPVPFGNTAVSIDAGPSESATHGQCSSAMPVGTRPF